MKERFRIKKAMFAYVRNNDKLPQSIINRFKTKDNSNYNLRNKYTDFVLKKPKTNFMKKSTTYSAASLWNKLPKSAKTKGIPIYKSENRSKCENYRPISILRIISKVFEREVFNQIYRYLNENSLISKFQSGFRPKYGTVSALIQSAING